MDTTEPRGRIGSGTALGEPWRQASSRRPPSVKYSHRPEGDQASAGYSRSRAPRTSRQSRVSRSTTATRLWPRRITDTASCRPSGEKAPEVPESFVRDGGRRTRSTVVGADTRTARQAPPHHARREPRVATTHASWSWRSTLPVRGSHTSMSFPRPKIRRSATDPCAKLHLGRSRRTRYTVRPRAVTSLNDSNFR